MQYRICPQCRNLNTEHVVFCLFCGKPFRRSATRIPREFSGSPRVRFTAARKFQNALFVLALFTAVLAVLSPWISASVASFSAFANTESGRFTQTDSTEPVFSQSSGKYAVWLYLSQAETEDAAAQSAADDIAGKRFDGDITVAVDAAGTGSIQIDQAFFSPKAISVAAFTDNAGVVSNNTLYGTTVQSGMKISIVCVCAEGSISGFIWLDNALSHIEFLYYS